MAFVGLKILGKYFQIAFLRDHFPLPPADPCFLFWWLKIVKVKILKNMLANFLIARFDFEYFVIFLQVYKGSYILGVLTVCHFVYGIV